MNFKEMVIKMVKNNSNPIFANLIDMAEKNDVQGLENFARNYCKEQGRDFDREMNNFQSMLNKNQK